MIIKMDHKKLFAFKWEMKCSPINIPYTKDSYQWHWQIKSEGLCTLTKREKEKKKDFSAWNSKHNVGRCRWAAAWKLSHGLRTIFHAHSHVQKEQPHNNQTPFVYRAKNKKYKQYKHIQQLWVISIVTIIYMNHRNCLFSTGIQRRCNIRSSR